MWKNTLPDIIFIYTISYTVFLIQWIGKNVYNGMLKNKYIIEINNVLQLDK